jgi:ribosome-associated protein
MAKNSPAQAGAPSSEDEARIAGRRLALLAAQAGMDKKALGIEIIDVVGRVDYADYLVLMTGTSDRHCAAIARGVEEDLAKAGHKALAVEGLPQATWVLIDLFDIVVHVFSEDSRNLYDLSGLWIDASRVPLPPRSAPTTPFQA